MTKKIIFSEVPYFKFYFPLVRNKVAHGVFLDSNELETIAFETLLDLQFMIHLFINHENMPYNRPLYIVEHLKNNKYGNVFLRNYLTNGDMSSRLDWLVNPMYCPIYKFYDDNCIIKDCVKKLNKVKEMLFSKQFFDCLLESYKNNKLNSKYEKFINLLHQYCIKNNHPCKVDIEDLKRNIKRFHLNSLD